MATTTVAVTQMAARGDVETNITRATALIREAVSEGADLVLPQEFLATPYFPKQERPEYFEYAEPLEESQVVDHFQSIAAELDVVLPVSFYERQNNAKFNSIAIIDADGTVLGVYRKSHIPDGPGYEEKYYFNPGDTGFQVWETAAGSLGVAICWDQWFPEAARAMALQGADFLLYPTAIGSEPPAPEVDTRDRWQRAMQGHAATNTIPVLASNRIGTETDDDVEITFYGSSFIADQHGEKVAEADRTEETVLTATFDPEAIQRERDEWGLFRDRRPDLYERLQSL